MQNPVTLGAERSAPPVNGGITRLAWHALTVDRLGGVWWSCWRVGSGARNAGAAARVPLSRRIAARRVFT